MAIKTNWQTYDWRHDGKASKTHVDISLAKDAQFRAKLTELLIAYIQPRRQFGSDFLSRVARYRCERALKKVTKLCAKTSAELIAFQFYGNTMALHFYCQDENAVEKTQDFIDGFKWAVVEYIERSDPRWHHYFDELFPNSAKQQTMRNKEMIELMVKYGDNVHLPRPVNHYASFPDEVSLTGFQGEIKRAGYALYDYSYIDDTPLAHSCCVRAISTIEKNALDEHTTRIVMIAEKYGGQYNSWDCKSMGQRKTAPKTDDIKIYKAGMD